MFCGPNAVRIKVLENSARVCTCSREAESFWRFLKYFEYLQKAESILRLSGAIVRIGPDRVSIFAFWLVLIYR